MSARVASSQPPADVIVIGRGACRHRPLGGRHADTSPVPANAPSDRAEAV